MKLPQAPLLNSAGNSAANSAKLEKLKLHRKNDASNDPRITPEMRKAAEGLEAVFTGQMMKAMRGTVEESEFSLRNHASDIYQGMLDQEYADKVAQTNSLGLSQQILDYWLRSMPDPGYNDNKAQSQTNMSTGGTHEGQSTE